MKIPRVMKSRFTLPADECVIVVYNQTTAQGNFLSSLREQFYLFQKYKIRTDD